MAAGVAARRTSDAVLKGEAGFQEVAAVEEFEDPTATATGRGRGTGRGSGSRDNAPEPNDGGSAGGGVEGGGRGKGRGDEPMEMLEDTSGEDTDMQE